jgi:deoxyribodipyrimidine photo-lyase
VATPEAAAAVDANPPLKQLVKALGDVVKKPDQGDCVVYWMRMHDLRSKSLLSWARDPTKEFVVSDNRAFSNACEQARRDKIPVIVLFVFSPQDWIAHDRGARKIDFTLRNLAILKVFRV